jgi:hypothetical protein
MQGSSRPDRRLLDAAAFCSHLVKEGSVHALLAEHRTKLFPDSMFEDLFPSGYASCASSNVGRHARPSLWPPRDRRDPRHARGEERTNLKEAP